MGTVILGRLEFLLLTESGRRLRDEPGIFVSLDRSRLISILRADSIKSVLAARPGKHAVF